MCQTGIKDYNTLNYRHYSTYVRLSKYIQRLQIHKTSPSTQKCTPVPIRLQLLLSIQTYVSTIIVLSMYTIYRWNSIVTFRRVQLKSIVSRSLLNSNFQISNYVRFQMKSRRRILALAKILRPDRSLRGESTFQTGPLEERARRINQRDYADALQFDESDPWYIIEREA